MMAAVGERSCSHISGLLVKPWSPLALSILSAVKREVDSAEIGILLGNLADNANRSLEALRDIAHGIFPPLLADKGARAAIDSAVRKLDVPVDVTYNDDFAQERFDPEAEAAVYFCCVEALRSAARNATTPLALNIESREGWIDFRIDSPAFRETPDDGVIERIVDRAEALGGAVTSFGTGLAGRIPTKSIPAVAQAR